MNSIMAEPALIGVAASFAVVTGANDGGALLSTGLNLRGPRLISSIAALAACVVAAPLLVSSGVARTFAARLVTSGAGTTLMAGVVVAVAVVAVLTYAGLPTSLTLAVIGGLTGAGLGSGLPVSMTTAVTVLGVGMLAPFAGGLLGYLICRLTALVPPGAGGALPGTHRVAFGLQCLAYGVNDGQKMLGVLLIATGGTAAGASQLALLTGCFVLGVLLGLPKVARTLGGTLLAVRPLHAVSAELAGSVAVLASAAAGVPVSMTQSLAGGLVGAGVSQGHGRIRWRGAGRIWLAWVLTLPASAGLSALVAWAIR
jgi:PiT family inorganic phosphate transporter